jgi:uncharacterized protein (TIGR00369 family)
LEQAGKARVSIPFPEELTQNAGFLHGAILFEVADTAGFIAANSTESTYSVLTVDYHINLMRPVQRQGVYALGEVIHRGKRLIIARSEVYSDSDRLVAVGQGTYMVSNFLLEDMTDYRIE